MTTPQTQRLTDNEITEAVVREFGLAESLAEGYVASTSKLTQLLYEERQAAKDVVGKCEESLYNAQGKYRIWYAVGLNDKMKTPFDEALTKIAKWKETAK